MKLTNALLCLDCDWIFDSAIDDYCPKCLSVQNWPLMKWVSPVRVKMSTAKIQPAEDIVLRFVLNANNS